MSAEPIRTVKRGAATVSVQPFPELTESERAAEVEASFNHLAERAAEGHVRVHMKARKSKRSGRYVGVEYRKQVASPMWLLPHVIPGVGATHLSLVVGWRFTAYKLLLIWNFRRVAVVFPADTDTER